MVRSKRSLVALTFFFALSVQEAFAQQGGACGFCDEAEEIVTRFALQEDEAPVRGRPNWERPAKIVTMLGEESAQALRTVVPTAEIIGVVEPEDAIQELAGAHVYIGLCNAAIVEAGTSLQWIHLLSAGADACASQPGVAEGDILLTSSQGLHSPAVADHAMALLLAVARRLNSYSAQQQRGEFEQPWANADVVLNSGIPELEGKALLITGLGAIGMEIARRGSAFGMRVRGTRNSSREGPDFVEYVGLADETEELVAWADIVVNALPLTDQTRGLFDSSLFEAMKSTAFFINVGRGETVVTADLVEALSRGSIAGAGLDVSDPEPLTPGHALWSMSNVVLTPHMAAASDQLERRLILLAMENLRRYTAGESLLSVVEARRGY